MNLARAADPTNRIVLHTLPTEFRPLTEEELKYCEKYLKPKEATREEVESWLGPVLRDVIRQYPTAPVTRGLVFARSDVALAEDDDSYDKILARLQANPGRLREGSPTVDIALPQDLVMRSQAMVDEGLGLIKVKKPDGPSDNPLMVLEDDDRVPVMVWMEQEESRTVIQNRTVKYKGTLTVPACVAREGSEAVRNYFNEAQLLPSLESGEEWEDSEVNNNDSDDPARIVKMDFGALKKFVPQGRDDDDGGDVSF